MASGDTLAEWVIPCGHPPASVYALFSTRNNIPILRFDPTTIWSWYFGAVLPAFYGGGGVTLTLFGMSAGTANDVVMGGAIERDNANNHDLDSDAFAAEQTGTSTVNGTSGKIFTHTITFTSGSNMDSLAAGEPFRLKVRRLATDGGDTSTADYQLVYARLAET